MVITKELKLKVWEKGIIDDRYPSNKVRKDACGAFILYDAFGDRNSIFGWEIDHIYPVSKLKEKGCLGEQIDNIINLRPLNCKNNASKADNYPFYTASLTASANEATNVKTNVGKVVHISLQEQLKNFSFYE